MLDSMYHMTLNHFEIAKTRFRREYSISGVVMYYTLWCLSVRPYSPFQIDTLSNYSLNFFKFRKHIVIREEWYGVVNW